MKASELRPGDLFAYTVLSSAGEYENHARMLENGRFRMTATGEEFELKNPGCPVRLIQSGQRKPLHSDTTNAAISRMLNAARRAYGCFRSTDEFWDNEAEHAAANAMSSDDVRAAVLDELDEAIRALEAARR